MNTWSRPSKARQPAPAARVIALVTAAAIVTAAMPAPARAQRGLPVIRDAETEQLLRDYTRPILRVAGLAQQHIRVVIINDRSFNAFVADGRRIFINVGTITEAHTPNEVIGVLAHETGHLAGGHLARMREQIAHAQTQMIIGMLLGVAAMGVAAKTGSSGAGQLGAAVLSAPQSMIMHSLLSYQRAQEEQADRAGVKFLTATGQSPKGMYDTFKRLADQSLFAAHGADPYLQSHPMPADRVAALAELAKSSPYWNKKDPPELQLRHDMVRAKLYAFLDSPGTLLRRYPPSNTSLPARYARAISAYRFGDLHHAIALIDDLIRTQPRNPYFYELKGQALLESGHGSEAIAPLRRAVQLSHNAPLIEILLGQALLSGKNPTWAHEAVSLLRTAVIREPDWPPGYTYLAMAYGRTGNLAYADLTSAQAALARGDLKTARQLATRAKRRFPVGSPGWVKSDDIVGVKPPKRHK
jgi:predicted Zn-dependent protease